MYGLLDSGHNSKLPINTKLENVANFNSMALGLFIQ